MERTCHLMQLLHCLDFHSLTQQDISNMLFYSVVSENDTVVQVLEAVRKLKLNLLADKRTEQNKDDQLIEENMEEIDEQDSERFDSKQEEIRTIVESVMKKSRRKLPQVPCVVGFKRSPFSLRRQKAKNSDDEDDQKQVWLPRIKNLEVIPVIYSFNPVTKKLVEEVVITKLCEGPVQCSGYQVCAVGKYHVEPWQCIMSSVTLMLSH